MRYIGTHYGPCRDCHANPHGDARADDCLRCHALSTWKARLAFDHDRDSRFRLNGRHAELACGACHKSPGPTAAMQLFGLGGQCVDCHKDVHAGGLGGDCRTCHSESGWKQRELKFAHNRDSRFTLLGAHATLECARCHVPPPGGPLAAAQFRGLGKRCDQCHKDPHAGQFKAACDRCHSQDGWKTPLRIDPHGKDSRFLLAGKHASVPCRQCHQPASAQAPLASGRFVGLSVACENCHKDPHAGQMSASCRTCHRETGWKGRDLLFAHDQHSSFRIDPLHGGVSCDGCHPGGKNARYRGADSTCQGCHSDVAAAMAGGAAAGSPSATPDPHSGRVRCVQCHDPSNARQRRDDFARACVNCHNPRYERLFLDWAASLDQHRAGAMAKLGQLPPDSPLRKELGQKIRQASMLHFHNLQAAIRLYKEVQRTPS